MRPDLNPADLTPDERRQELAELLARLRDRAALLTSHPISATQNLLDSETILDSGVALKPESWLRVATGYPPT